MSKPSWQNRREDESGAVDSKPGVGFSEDDPFCPHCKTGWSGPQHTDPACPILKLTQELKPPTEPKQRRKHTIRRER
jgi:hypothetical protein